MLCLLTGQSPEALLDLAGDTWSWQSYVKVSERLEHTLDKMLKFVPGQRFQSAEAVMAALWDTSFPPMYSSQPVSFNSADATAIVPDELTPPAQSNIETYLPPSFRATPQPQPPARVPPTPTPSPPSPPQPVLNPPSVAKCQQELAYFIGPIASLVVEEAITQYSPATLPQLVDILMQEIPDAQAALEFRRKLLS